MKKYQVIMLAVLSAFLFGGYSYESIPTGEKVSQTGGEGFARLAQAEEFSFSEGEAPHLISQAPSAGETAGEIEEGMDFEPSQQEEEEAESEEKASEAKEEEPESEEKASDTEEEEADPEKKAADVEEEKADSEENTAVVEEDEAGSKKIADVEEEEADFEEAFVLEDTSSEEEDYSSKEKAGEASLEEAEEQKKETALPNEKKKKKALKKAQKLALQYDYKGAIAELRAVKHYKNDEEIVEQIRSYRAAYKACVPYPLANITHIFFHSLVVDTSRAFDGDYNSAGYNQVMTTVKEFRKIIEIMYAKGYVLVSPHDMAYKDENGVMQRGEILLPEGKIPFVLSQDDVSYYHYMDGDGLASKLVLDEDGKVKCEYLRRDGAVVVGDYDLVPIIDTFVKEHPDFSYHGRKGILAMTGYNGVLGYRTDKEYWVRENLDELQIKYLEEHPDFDFAQEVNEARAVAEAMKAEGWEFASHTWGHQNATTASVEELIADDGRYKESVVPVLGETDMIIFAFGADIGNWDPYTYSNPKFSYYKGAGYDYFCNVDSSQYWVQITGDYFRQGRRNLDGYRMYYNPEMLSDLFDVSLVWDKARPVPVAPMG